ncbi:MAG: STAS domain-containing protein [Actinomycetes bacterium]
MQSVVDAGSPAPSGGAAPGAGPVVVLLDDDTLLDGLSRLRSAVAGQVASGGCDLVVDIAGVRRLSSATVAALLWARRHSRCLGRRVVVRGPSPESLQVLRRTGLSEVFEVEPRTVS